MTGAATGSAAGETIRVRYWAAARAAAGTGEDRLPVDAPVTLAEVRDSALALHPDADRLSSVLGVCSALVDDAPAGTSDPAEVVVRPGQTVEFLPPFAGG